MAQLVTLEHRVTHTYVDKYAHLDQWGESFTFKALEPKLIATGDGYDHGPVHVQRFIGSKSADQKSQIKALYDNLSYSGCSHEYDCCGCASVHASIRKVRRGVFTALLRTSFNY